VSPRLIAREIQRPCCQHVYVWHMCATHVICACHKYKWYMCTKRPCFASTPTKRDSRLAPPLPGLALNPKPYTLNLHCLALP
jgi:hypothetical protein